MMAKAVEEAQLQCEEETKGLLKTPYFIAQNKLANAKFCHLVKFMKEVKCPGPLTAEFSHPNDNVSMPGITSLLSCYC